MVTILLMAARFGQQQARVGAREHQSYHSVEILAARGRFLANARTAMQRL